MALSHSPSIVTDGLVLCLDAANLKSYPGSGVTWGDLSNINSSATLTNGPSFLTTNNGNFSFDGANDYAQFSGSFSLNQATFLCWIRRSGNQNEYTGIFFGRQTTATGINLTTDGVTNNQLGYTWNGTSSTFLWRSGLVVPNLTWCMIAVTVTPTLATGYLNLSTATNSVTHNTTTFENIRIASDSYNSFRFMSGNIAVVKLYNRALSSQEISQNFNALRGRFNL